LWCADYKGEFMLGNRRYCYPLTITDFASRYRLTCEALSTTQEQFAFTVFERTFKEFGLPQGIRTDNGVPFASAQASTDSVNCPCGGYASGFRSSASHPASRNQTAGTSGCI
jgi:transposase InsO family protein